MKYVTMLLVFLAAILVLGTGTAQATDISGLITTTMTIFDDSKLTGDVTCTVVGAPCIKFGAADIELHLNGFTITGRGSRDSCTLVSGEHGIDTNGQNHASIEGPGIVRRFKDNGIVVSGNDSAVQEVVVASSCTVGIDVLGSQNKIEENSVVRSPLHGFDAIVVGGSGGHRILRNEVVGAVGVGVVVATGSNNNLIEGNSASASTDIGIFIVGGSTGNTIRDNQALGNFGSISNLDVRDDNTLGSNTYKGNLCEVSFGGVPANVCNPVARAGHQNPK
jgi:parallel beta-helix repeat protein